MGDYLDIVIPSSALPADSPANLKLADPVLLNYYKAVDERVLWLDSTIDENTVELTKQIMIWNGEDSRSDILPKNRRPIHLYILSAGGSVYQMNALMDAILMSTTPVYTYNMGLAASAACVVFLCGEKRYAAPHSHAMWHSGAAGLEGTMEQIQSASKHFDRMEDQMRDFLISRTNVDLKLYRRYKDKDWYLDANEQIEYGFATDLISNDSKPFPFSNNNLKL